MFHEHHHRSSFPLLIVGLTLALLLFLALLFGPTVRDQSRGLLRPSASIAQTYERAVGDAMIRLDERLELSADAEARYDVLSAATSELLALTVPASHQSVHLELVVSLDLLRQGALGDAAKVAEGERRLAALRDVYLWL